MGTSRKASARRPAKRRAISLESLRASLAGALAHQPEELASKYPGDPVASVLNEGKRLLPLLAAERRTLIAAADLDAAHADTLAPAIDYLTFAEARWQSLRATQKGAATGRAKGEKLRSEMLRAARRFLRRDAAAMQLLDAIADGRGDGDLIDDLRKLADVYEANPSRLPAPKQPKDLAARARAAADALAAAIGLALADESHVPALAERNRAYWLAVECITEVRDAGEYLHADDARKAQRYRGPRVRRTAAGDSTAKPGTSTASPSAGGNGAGATAGDATPG